MLGIREVDNSTPVPGDIIERERPVRSEGVPKRALPPKLGDIAGSNFKKPFGFAAILVRKPTDQWTDRFRSEIGEKLLWKVGFFNDTATTGIYTLSLHDALPICDG